MSIYHFTESLGGGVLTSVKNLTEVQVDSGYQVSLIFLRRTDTPGSADLLKMFPGVNVLEIGSSGPMGFLKFLSYVIRTLISKRSAIFHAHSSWAGVLVRLVNLFIRTSKCFYTPHGYAHLRTDISRISRFLFLTTEVVLNLTSGARVISCGPTEAKVATRLLSLKVIKSSNYLKDSFEKYVTVFPKSRDNGERFKVATAGRITAQKGPERFLRALNYLDHSVEVEWIGSGTEGNLLSKNNVAISGWLKPEAVAKKLSELDALLITSDWEGLSMIGLEALSLGIPIISWSYYGSKDLVEHGYNGFICYDDKDFSLYIKILCEDKKLHNEMQLNARKSFLDKFDQKILYQNWSELYLEIRR